MFKIITTHEKFVTLSGVEMVPVLTLSEWGSLCHIVEDDGCYVCYLYIEDSGYVPVTHIFPELHAALCSLPTLEETS
jgi:hypothetical protein